MRASDIAAASRIINAPRDRGLFHVLRTLVLQLRWLRAHVVLIEARLKALDGRDAPATPPWPRLEVPAELAGDRIDND